MLRACQLPRTVLLQIEKANMSDSNSKELAYKNRTPIGQASGFVAEETEIDYSKTSFCSLLTQKNSFPIQSYAASLE